MHLFTSRRDKPGIFRGHAHRAPVPVNPVCWLTGHTPRGRVLGRKYNDPFLLVECRVCAARWQPSDLYKPTGTHDFDAAKALQRRHVERHDTDGWLLGATRHDSDEGHWRRGGWGANVEAVWQPRYHATRWALLGWRERATMIRDNLGFSISLGSTGSETPIDAAVHAGLGSVYLSVESPGRWCEIVGRGHKRTLSLNTHSGSVWWKVWYDGDCGNDAHHDCDKWRQPRLWPWSTGRRKYRSWMCLRDGSLDLNPADALWGGGKYDSTPVGEPVIAAVAVGDFPGDTYLVTLTRERQVRRRQHGPRWARRVLSDEVVVEWDASGLCPGIPVRNHAWKGDHITASSVRCDDPTAPGWEARAVAGIIAAVRRDRETYGYQPPADVSDQR